MSETPARTSYVEQVNAMLDPNGGYKPYQPQTLGWNQAIGECLPIAAQADADREALERRVKELEAEKATVNEFYLDLHEMLASALGEHPDTVDSELMAKIEYVRHEARDYCNVARDLFEARNTNASLTAEVERLRKALDLFAQDDIDCKCDWYGGVCACGRKLAAAALAQSTSGQKEGE